MRKIYSSIAVFSVLITANFPIIAQKNPLAKGAVVEAVVESANFGDVAAYSDGDGAFIRWQMVSERDNVGFNVYRLTDAGQLIANDGLIIGSKGRYGSETAFGEAYSFFDEAGTPGSLYLIESVGANGERRFSGKSMALYSANPGFDSDPTAIIPNTTKREKRRSYDSARLQLPLDLANEVAKNQSTPDPAEQRILVAQDGVKLGVKSDGLYRVTRAELQAAGFDVGSNPANWQLFANGVEQTILVESNGNYIEFFGKVSETVESDKSYYFLIVGNSAGRRMASRSSRPSTSTVASTSYRQSFFKKERVNYISSIRNGDAENYWGNVITSTASTFTFNLTGIDFSSPVSTVEVKIQGLSTATHSVALALNGQALPTAVGSGTTPFSVVANLPTSALIEGANSLMMTSGASNDFSLFDSIKVDFARKFKSDQNRIAFYSDNYKRATVAGFASGNVRLFDTTLDGSPLEVLNPRIVQNGATFDLELPAARGRVLYAVETAGIRSVATIQRNFGSDLRNVGNQAKLVIITHRDFLNEANTWAAYRQTAQFPVMVVDVEDIFDEFNYGQPSAASINALLRHATSNWLIRPEYLLILGDASYDPKNYNGFGYLNLVPSKMINTIYEETSSDEALADFNNDGLAEMAVGRIPARTASVVSQAFAKVTAFETPAMQNLNRGAVFAFDLPVGYDFEAMSQILRNELPASIPAPMVSRGAANAATTLLNEINNGRYIVNYAGHGSTGVWAATSFFGINSVPLLTNANSQSIFTMLTCLNGYFIRPDADSIGEALLKAPNGGAAAAWASTGQTTPDIQSIMGQRFYNQVAAGNITRIGDLIRDAKSAVPGGSDVRLSWALLGDPMLKIR